jgi:hypothetical protein
MPNEACQRARDDVNTKNLKPSLEVCSVINTYPPIAVKARAVRNAGRE